MRNSLSFNQKLWNGLRLITSATYGIVGATEVNRGLSTVGFYVEREFVIYSAKLVNIELYENILYNY